MNEEGRRYEVLRLLGEGGFGRVYKARMKGAGGFSKEVAIKLLTEADAPEHVLERFRDESRILGLVRDRAIISVDPPTRLDGRWAVIMEFVDGVNCAALVKRSPLPARVAVEVIQEVARALDHVYNAPGPDGLPLQLIHRDLKPDNLQITPSGDVKILDFGIARANFDTREARTTTSIAGTFGYIAPERMEGEELPAGDIYSLGVVLKVLLTGKRPSRRRGEDEESADPAVLSGLALADRMCDPEPESRPTAAELEREAQALAEQLPGTPLRYWARDYVPAVMEHLEDDLVGTVLTETMSMVKVRLEDERGLIAGGGRLAVAAAAGTVGITGVMAAVFLFSLSVGLVVYLAASRGQSPTAQTAPVPSVVPNTATEDVPVAASPAPAEGEVAVEEVAEPGEEAPPDEAPEPLEEAGSAGSAEPVETPPPPPVQAPQLVTIGSVPLGADVYVDGVLVGQTPLANLKLSSGSHRLKLVLGDAVGETTVTVGPGESNKFIWRGGDRWQVRF